MWQSNTNSFLSGTLGLKSTNDRALKWLESGDTDAAEEITEVDGIHEIAVHMTTSVRHFMKRLMKSDLKRYTWVVESFEKMLRDSSGLSRDGHIRWTNVTLKKQRYGGKRVWNWTQLMRPFGVDGL